jgi:hypothetical protein
MAAPAAPRMAQTHVAQSQPRWGTGEADRGEDIHTLGIPLGMQGYWRTARLQSSANSAQCGELGRVIFQPVRPP